MKPYVGKDKYIFVSYSHYDSDEAMEIIETLQEKGYRVWYDGDLTAASNYIGTIAERVMCCDFFIPLISKKYIESHFCDCEINYAREMKKPTLPIFIEECGLPFNLKKYIDRLRCIDKFSYKDMDSFIKKIEESPEISVCHHSLAETTAISVDESLTAEKKHKTPYTGNEEFIFISYAHKDSVKAMEIIEALQEKGYRVWYDEGITPAADYIEHIAKYIQKSSYFIPFFSEHYMESEFCNYEIKYAVRKKKNIFPIYIEECELSVGLDMLIGQLQHCRRFDYSDMESFIAIVEKAQGIFKYKELA